MLPQGIYLFNQDNEPEISSLSHFAVVSGLSTKAGLTSGTQGGKHVWDQRVEDDRVGCTEGSANGVSIV